MSDLHPIKAYRLKEGIGPSAFGKRFGVSRITVFRWEAGTRRPEKEMAQRIEEATGIDARVLLGIPKRNPQKRREVA